MTINNLTTQRTQLMGFSILWIMLFHSDISFPDNYLFLNYIKDTGYTGVDIFFLLSGIGISFSISKHNTLANFYKRRVIRIIPTFWIFLAFIWVKNLTLKDSIPAYIWTSFLGIDFLVYGRLTYWFISAILICYLFTPIYNQLLTKHNNKQVLLFIVTITIVCSLLIADTRLSRFLIFTTRIPNYIFGLYLGFLLMQGKKVFLLNNLYINTGILLASVSVLFVILQKTSPDLRWSTGLWWYPTSVMTFPLAMIVASLLNTTYTITHVVSNILKLFGVYSLELYLIHPVIFEFATEYLSTQKNDGFTQTAVFLTCIGIALFFSSSLQFCARVTSRTLLSAFYGKSNK